MITGIQHMRGKWQWRRLVWRILIGIAALLALLAAGVLIVGADAKATLKAQHPPPGQLIDIGGYRLHFACQGEGSPTVIMEAGQNEFSVTWALVRPQLAQSARVCVYDRAGLGWSDPSPRPRTADVVVDELHSLLGNAGVAPPYVFVGHSMGGLYARLYAATYPADVAGMVLVDATHEDQFQRFPNRQALEQLIERSQRQARMLGSLASIGLLALDPAQTPVAPQLPTKDAADYQALIASGSVFFETMASEIAAQEVSLAAARTASSHSLGDIPLIVLAHGRPDPTFAALDLTPAQLAQWEQTWRELQIDLAARSTRGQLVVAEQSGHYIQLDQPDLVIDAVRRALAAVRAR